MSLNGALNITPPTQADKPCVIFSYKHRLSCIELMERGREVFPK